MYKAEITEVSCFYLLFRSHETITERVDCNTSFITTLKFASTQSEAVSPDTLRYQLIDLAPISWSLGRIGFGKFMT